MDEQFALDYGDLHDSVHGAVPIAIPVRGGAGTSAVHSSEPEEEFVPTVWHGSHRSSPQLSVSPLSSSPPGTWSLLDFARRNLEEQQVRSSDEPEEAPVMPPGAQPTLSNASASSVSALGLALAMSPNPVLFQR